MIGNNVGTIGAQGFDFENHRWDTLNLVKKIVK
jgi:hypothetical protein